MHGRMVVTMSTNLILNQLDKAAVPSTCNVLGLCILTKS